MADRGDIVLELPMHPNPKVRAMLRLELGTHTAIRSYRRGISRDDYPMSAASMIMGSGGSQGRGAALGRPC